MTTGLALAAVGALFAFGAAMIAVFARRRPGAADYWAYYASEIAIVAAVLVPAALHRGAFLAVLAAGAARCAWELAVLYHRAGRTAAGVLAAAAFPLAGAAALASIALREDAFAWIFLLFLVVEAQDAMAWLFGRLFGRRALLPRLSPGKTVEGALGGVAAAGAAGVPVAMLGLGMGAVPAFALCALIAASGFAGDVLASALKRAAGAKDFPPVHRLHGGLLDIYDAFLLAAIPLAVLLSSTILP